MMRFQSGSTGEAMPRRIHRVSSNISSDQRALALKLLQHSLESGNHRPNDQPVAGVMFKQYSVGHQSISRAFRLTNRSQRLHEHPAKGHQTCQQ